MIDIYVHFDGDLKCQSHLYEKLVRFLSKHSLPDATLGGGPATSSSHQSQCLDALLVLLHQIPGKSSELLSTQQKDAHKKAAGLVSTSKKQKRVLMQGIEKFNEDPKDGIAFLQSNKFLPTPCDPKSLAHLFKFTPQIKKNVLGQFFAKKNNEDVLRAFLLYFDFKGVSKRCGEVCTASAI